ncbi:nuclear transport factor 2 family protein [Polaribacter sp. Asnod1-A03]|uniref:nuclear transport factor 2 family protein n=1 Tax=Polaribacter sp. Asnod1-A03 TaxID=3160581 RepID=UPI00386843F7
MKYKFLLPFLIFSLPFLSQTHIANLSLDKKTFSNTADKKVTPEDLAQQQLDAYNLRDIEAFLEPYAEDVEVYTFPNTLNYKGKETMRKRYGKMFKDVTNLHCELENRIVKGNVVIDKERVQFNDKIIEALAIYHIENNKIKKVYFVRN